MSELRLATLAPLLIADAPAKAAATLALDTGLPVDPTAVLAEPAGIPGRPAHPRLVAHVTLKPPSMRTPAGIAALVHAIAHIELNAIDLALDICWRFPGMPEAFYRDWLRIAREEAKHFALLREHLLTLGFDYGAFDAHNALWDMAERTKHDLLARIALVPRTLEARGLDASPAVKRKLVGAGDHRAGQILDVILSDEIGHVAAGNRWYRFLCEQRGLDPIATYAELAARHQAPKLRAPFNLEARRAAGFDEAELAALAHP
ncbi:MAG TPA: ferritin-like domain-containing protein [Roseateles sp.]|uniref:ferritin-like domain-containing protein n=1 Tax=Roseateles sp. TaxID=1971397 RepID=UPI002EDB4633